MPPCGVERPALRLVADHHRRFEQPPVLWEPFGEVRLRLPQGFRQADLEQAGGLLSLPFDAVPLGVPDQRDCVTAEGVEQGQLAFPEIDFPVLPEDGDRVLLVGEGLVHPGGEPGVFAGKQERADTPDAGPDVLVGVADVLGVPVNHLRVFQGVDPAGHACIDDSFHIKFLPKSLFMYRSGPSHNCLYIFSFMFSWSSVVM